MAGNPIVLASGNKLQREMDISDIRSSGVRLRFERFFNGTLGRLSGPLMSTRWTHSFSYGIYAYDVATVYALRPTGQMYVARSPGQATSAGLQQWVADTDVVEQVYEEVGASLQPVGWLVVARDGGVESYDAFGNLLSIEEKEGRSVTTAYANGSAGFALDANWNPSGTFLPAGLLVQVLDSFGRSLKLGYNSSSQLVQVTDASGLNYRYTYDASGNLSSVIYPDGRTRQYLYNESTYTGGASLPNSLTGIVDENGTRFASYWYNSSGQATNEVHWADSAQTKAVDQYQVTLNANGTSTMTDPLNSQTTFGYQVINGVHFPTSQSQPAGAGCGPASSSASYDTNGNATSRQDFDGNITTASYDTTRNLETRRTEAYGTAQARTISTQWHPTFRVKTAEATPLKTTYWVYNGQPDPTNNNATANCAPTTLGGNEPGALLHFDGADGSTSFTDQGGRTWSAHGTAAVSTAQSKFGGASGHFDGSNNSYVSTPYDSGLAYGSADFTIEMWVYVTANNSNYSRLWNPDGDYYDGVNLAINPSGGISSWGTTTGSSWNAWAADPVASLTANAWHHIAAVRTGGTVKVYVDGVGHTMTTTLGTSALYTDTTHARVIGGQGVGTNRNLSGYVDEFRLTIGYAQYTADFIPPSAPLSLTRPNVLADGVPPAVLCKKVEQATTDATGAAGFSATATGNLRVWTYTYNAYGQVLTATGPRGNLPTNDPNYALSTTTTQYYAATDTAHSPPWYQMGDKQSVTDALGHVTQFTKYDGNGRLLESVDPNGVTTDYAYYPRGWLQTVTVTPAGGGSSLVTSYTYDGVGQLTQTTMPDGSYVKNTYDAAHRLTQVTDSAGDTVNYTLDAIGNRQAEQWKDPGGALKRNIARSYDALNRLQQITGAPQ